MPRPGAHEAVASEPQPAVVVGSAPVVDPGARLDVAAFRAESGVDAALARLDRELIGLEPVKRRLSEIAALLLVHRLRERFGLATARPNLHMCFTGPPGTGKTTVATRLGEILHQLGFLPSQHIVTVGREELVGQYVGHTAPKTKEVLKRAMGGVLFIDEAYALHRRDNERDYGQEAIEMLLQVMEDRRDDLVVVLAGYRDLMDAFFATNPGLRSRIAHHIDFPDFSDDELVEIGHRMLDEQGYRLTPAAEATFRAYVERRRVQPHFANARSVRNAVERARLRHAARVVAGGTDIGLADLVQIEPEDLLRSAVFRTDRDEPGCGLPRRSSGP